jgi:hypothetical protein
METVIPPSPPVLLPIAESLAGFPVRRVYCVGRNYAAHAREMGHDPDREPPFFFQKNADNLLPPGQDFPYPPRSSDVHHEVELVVALRGGGADRCHPARPPGGGKKGRPAVGGRQGLRAFRPDLGHGAGDGDRPSG